MSVGNSVTSEWIVEVGLDGHGLQSGALVVFIFVGHVAHRGQGEVVVVSGVFVVQLGQGGQVGQLEHGAEMIGRGVGHTGHVLHLLHCLTGGQVGQFGGSMGQIVLGGQIGQENPWRHFVQD